MKFKMASLFNERKATEVAAFFLLRAKERDANITLLKLMKLMYLSERMSYERYGFPIIGDRLVSMPNGPVLSITLDLMNCESDGAGYWDKLIADRSNRDMSLKEGVNLTVDQLDALSDSDVEILDIIWEKFGRFSAIKLRDYTHDPENCPEWQDPDGSSNPIDMQAFLGGLGYGKDEAASIMNNLRHQAWINSVLSGS